MVNKLKGMRTYLIGAIDRCPDGGKTWREKITVDLKKMGVVTINPLRKPLVGDEETEESRAKRHLEKQNGNFDYLIAEKPIRLKDLRFVDVSDFLIGMIDTQVSPCGTYEELFTGNRQKKPILIWSPRGKKDIPDWLWWTLPKEFIFENEEEILEYLKGINDGSIEPNKRWVFMDFSLTEV